MLKEIMNTNMNINIDIEDIEIKQKLNKNFEEKEENEKEFLESLDPIFIKRENDKEFYLDILKMLNDIAKKIKLKGNFFILFLIFFIEINY
jgi:hypothetical protein